MRGNGGPALTLGVALVIRSELGNEPNRRGQSGGSDAGNPFATGWMRSGRAAGAGFVFGIVFFRIVFFQISAPGSGGEAEGRIEGDAGVGGLPELQEQGEGAIVLAVVGGFLAEMQGEDAGVVG